VLKSTQSSGTLIIVEADVPAYRSASCRHARAHHWTGQRFRRNTLEVSSRMTRVSVTPGSVAVLRLASVYNSASELGWPRHTPSEQPSTESCCGVQ